MKKLIKNLIKNATNRDVLIPIFKNSRKVNGLGEEYYDLACGIKVSIPNTYSESANTICVKNCVLSRLAFERAFELNTNDKNMSNT